MLLISPSDFHVFDKRFNHPVNQDGFSWDVVLYFSIPFIVVIGALVYTWFRNGGEFWKENGFPANFKYSDKNYAKILIAFGCVISAREEDYVLREKLSWINTYLNKNSGKSVVDVLGTYEYIVSRGINIQKLVAWANKNLGQTEKVSLLEFVIQLANTDGSINSGESEFIFYLLRKLQVSLDSLTPSVKDLLIEDRKTSFNTQKSLAHYFKILGLPETATPLQVKSAYRKLVKIHHPDNNRRSGEVEKRMHVGRFLEIQQAYEILTSPRGGR